LVRSLTIKNGDESFNGEYTCEFVKTKDSCKAKVIFMDSPFETDPADSVIFVGEDASFEIRTKESDAHCSWTVNGSTNDDRFVTPKASGFDRKLMVKSCKTTDTGKVLCIVRGNEEKPVSCDLRVIDHLKFVDELKNMDVKESTEVNFTVKTNKECSSVTWYYNRKEIRTDHQDWARFTQTISEDKTTYNLVFKATVDDDEAKFEFTANAELKESMTTDSVLRVAGASPPKIVVQESEICIPVGIPASIMFELKGQPAPVITATNIDNEKAYKIEKNPEVKCQRFVVIEKVERADAGSFKITAKNDNGEDIQLITVKVIDKPNAPQNVAISKMTNDSCGFGWTAPTDNGGDVITRYSIEFRIAGGDWKQQFTTEATCEFTLTNLTKGKSIEIRVAGENKAGVGEYSKPSDPAEIGDGVFPPGLPIDVKVKMGEVRKDIVPMEWKEPASTGGAPITGYEIEKCIDGSDTWEKCAETGVGTNGSVKSPAVKEGKMYRFRVRARNSAGLGGPCEPTDTITVEDPSNKPGSPTAVKAENPSTDSIDVSWSVPVKEIAVEKYFIEKLQHGHENWVKCGTLPENETAFTVGDLEQETKYIFRVFAENSCGVSLPSEMSNPCITLTGSGNYELLIKISVGNCQIRILGIINYIYTGCK
jgi:hypothetical protein